MCRVLDPDALEQRGQFAQARTLDSISGLEMEVVQRRDILRKVRNVFHIGEEIGPALTELAIDSVVHHFENQIVRHYELEIEAKRQDGSLVI